MSAGRVLLRPDRKTPSGAEVRTLLKRAYVRRIRAGTGREPAHRSGETATTCRTEAMAWCEDQQ